jgi:hypothetical protein
MPGWWWCGLGVCAGLRGPDTTGGAPFRGELAEPTGYRPPNAVLPWFCWSAAALAARSGTGTLALALSVAAA